MNIQDVPVGGYFKMCNRVFRQVDQDHALYLCLIRMVGKGVKYNDTLDKTTEVIPMKPAGRTSAGDEVFLDEKENCDEG